MSMRRARIGDGAGLAPDPALHPQAIVQVYAARPRCCTARPGACAIRQLPAQDSVAARHSFLAPHAPARDAGGAGGGT